MGLSGAHACPQVSNPFVFKHIHHLKSPAHLDDNSAGPCVVMATPSMLQVTPP
jgi:hypothetical protein